MENIMNRNALKNQKWFKNLILLFLICVINFIPQVFVSQTLTADDDIPPSSEYEYSFIYDNALEGYLIESVNFTVLEENTILVAPQGYDDGNAGLKPVVGFKEDFIKNISINGILQLDNEENEEEDFWTQAARKITYIDFFASNIIFFGESSFENAYIRGIRFLNENTVFEKKAFAGNSSLFLYTTTFVVPNLTIGENAFDGCNASNFLRLANDVKINKNAFANNINLKTLIIVNVEENKTEMDFDLDAFGDERGEIGKNNFLEKIMFYHGEDGIEDYISYNASFNGLFKSYHIIIYYLFEKEYVAGDYTLIDFLYVERGENIIIELPDPTWEHYTFVRWEIEMSEGENVPLEKRTETEGYIYPTYLLNSVVKDIEILSVWESHEREVVFNANGGIIGEDSSVTFFIPYGTSYILFQEPEREGYSFVAWYKSLTFSEDDLIVFFDENGNPLREEIYDENGNLLPVEERGFINKVPEEGITLYAKWQAYSYTIKFDANTGTGEIASVNRTYDQSTDRNLPANTFTKAGYSFIGWATLSNGNVVFSDKEDVNFLTEPNATVTLYAVWQANSYTIAFGANAGLGLMENINMIYDDPINLPQNLFAKTGHTFMGWSTTSGGSVEYTNEQQVNIVTTPNQTITLYAVWQANSYTISFNSNTGSGTMTSINRTYDQATGRNLPANTFTKTGYHFMGWSTSSDGNKEYNDEEEINILTEPNETISLYAVWQVNIYTISFNSNTGSGEMTNQNFYFGTPQNLTKNTFTKTGHTFLGWSTSSDGNKEYNDEQEINLVTTHNQTITLYAVWQANSYTIVFDANTGSGTMASINRIYDQVTGRNLPANTFTKTGYTFLGWSITFDGNKEYNDEQEINFVTTHNQTITLYAVWQANSYTIVFDANTGSGTMASINRIYDQESDRNLPANTFAKTGHTFLGWSTTSNGSVAFYDAQMINIPPTEPNQTITFYAVWQVKIYTLTIEYGPFGYTIQTIKNYNYYHLVSFEEILNGIGENVYNLPGHNLEWRDEENNEIVLSTASFNMPDKNIIIKAHYSIRNHVLTFIFNNNTEDQVENLDYGTAFFQPETSFTGHSFIGWYDNENFEGNIFNFVINGNAVTMPDENVTLYAKWQINSYFLTIYNKSNNAELLKNKYDYNTSFNSQNLFDFAAEQNDLLNIIGQTFVAWFSESEIKIDETFTMPDNDLKIYATYSINNYTITFKKNNGEEDEVVQLVYDQEISLILPEKPNHDFIAWYESEGFAGSHFTKLTMPAENIVLYAKFKIKTFNFVFEYFILHEEQYLYQKYEESYLDYGTVIEDMEDLLDLLGLKEENLQKLGHSFAYWKIKDGEQFVFPHTVTASVNIEAFYQLQEYVLTYVTNKEANGVEFESVNIFFDEKPTLPIPRFNNWQFLGWFYDNNSFLQSAQLMKMPAYNLTIYAKWERVKFDVHFIINYERTEIQLIEFEGKAVDYIPILNGFSFLGWFTSNDNETATPYDFNSLILNVTKIYAHWEIINYNISFILPEGFVNHSKNNIVKFNTDYIFNFHNPDPEPPYSFKGWYKDYDAETNKYSNQITSTFEQYENLQLYALFVIKYTITFNTGYDLTIEAIETDSSENFRPPIPVRANYTFIGWFVDEKFTQPWTSDMGYEDITLYAKWESHFVIVLKYFGFLLSGIVVLWGISYSIWKVDNFKKENKNKF